MGNSNNSAGGCTASAASMAASLALLENSQRYATHLMASDMSGLLAPPSRSNALARAHTDPSSANYDQIQPTQQRTPNSPPPTYDEVMKQVLLSAASSAQPASTATTTTASTTASVWAGLHQAPPSVMMPSCYYQCGSPLPCNFRSTEKTRIHTDCWTKQASFI